MPVITYLSFNGNCREAFDFYVSVFGGEYAFVQTFGDAPVDIGVPDVEKGNIMHATLQLGDGLLMGSDMPSTMGPPRTIGNNFSLTYPTQSREETDDLFAKVSEGGTVTMPLQDQFWGAYFGACVDKFGIQWQFNFETPREQE